MGFPGGSDGKESVCNMRDPSLIPGWKDLLEKGMPTHSSTFAWRILWTEEFGELKSRGCRELDMTELTLALFSRFICVYVYSHICIYILFLFSPLVDYCKMLNIVLYAI